MAPPSTRIPAEETSAHFPPSWSLTSEVAVLGGVLVARPEDREVVAQVLGDLEPDAFHRDSHRVIWRAMRALHPEADR